MNHKGPLYTDKRGNFSFPTIGEDKPTPNLLPLDMG